MAEELELFETCWRGCQWVETEWVVLRVRWEKERWKWKVGQGPVCKWEFFLKKVSLEKTVV
jgi:hypothetical protein